MSRKLLRFPLHQERCIEMLLVDSAKKLFWLLSAQKNMYVSGPSPSLSQLQTNCQTQRPRQQQRNNTPKSSLAALKPLDDASWR